MNAVSTIEDIIKPALIIRDDLTAQRFGRLTVMSPAYQKNHITYYKCKCDCGTQKIIRGTLIKNNSIKSCGCLQREARKAKKTHGLCSHPLYSVWSAMKTRCADKKNPNYGGRGIEVEKEWVDDFKIFFDWCMENGYKKGMSLDRIDVNGNYGSKNCRFISLAEQNRNKTNNKLYQYQGKQQFLKDISEQCGVPESVLWYHLKKGKVVEEIIEQYTPRIAIEDPILYEKRREQLQEIWYLNKQLQLIPKEQMEILFLNKFPGKLVADVVEKSQTTLYRHKKKYS